MIAVWGSSAALSAVLEPRNSDYEPVTGDSRRGEATPPHRPRLAAPLTNILDNVRPDSQRKPQHAASEPPTTATQGHRRPQEAPL